MIPKFIMTIRELEYIFWNLKSMGFVSLQEYRLSEWWNNKREAVLSVCKSECMRCNKTKGTIVHHLTYEHLGNETLRDIVILCKQCNKWVHE